MEPWRGQDHGNGIFPSSERVDCGLWRDAGSATCANCSMWKIAEERGTGTEKGREDAEEREVGSQSRKIAIKIRTTRHKKHGNGMQQTAAATAIPRQYSSGLTSSSN